MSERLFNLVDKFSNWWQKWEVTSSQIGFQIGGRSRSGCGNYKIKKWIAEILPRVKGGKRPEKW